MRPCRLSLALFAGARAAQAMIARISLALDREGERILARRRRLPITAQLVLSGAGRTPLVEQGRFTLTR